MTISSKEILRVKGQHMIIPAHFWGTFKAKNEFNMTISVNYVKDFEIAVKEMKSKSPIIQSTKLVLSERANNFVLSERETIMGSRFRAPVSLFVHFINAVKQCKQNYCQL